MSNVTKTGNIRNVPSSSSLQKSGLGSGFTTSLDKIDKINKYIIVTGKGYNRFTGVENIKELQNFIEDSK